MVVENKELRGGSFQFPIVLTAPATPENVSCRGTCRALRGFYKTGRLGIPVPATKGASGQERPSVPGRDTTPPKDATVTPMTASKVQEAIRDLEGSGFTDHQADAVVRTVDRLNDELATKADLDRVKAEIDVTRAELKGEIKQANAKLDRMPGSLQILSLFLAANGITLLLGFGVYELLRRVAG